MYVHTRLYVNTNTYSTQTINYRPPIPYPNDDYRRSGCFVETSLSVSFLSQSNSEKGWIFQCVFRLIGTVACCGRSAARSLISHAMCSQITEKIRGMSVNT